MSTTLFRMFLRVWLAVLGLGVALGAWAQGTTTVVEFYNTGLNHYFITASAAEAAAIDAGSAGQGWTRTGQSFLAWTSTGPGMQPVCRFYGTPGRGPNSHFFTADPPECDAVKSNPAWTFEGIAFYAPQPVNGQCASGQVGVYRVYNDRAAQNDVNHRYVTDSALYASMAGQGWRQEGLVFCVVAAASAGSYSKYLTFSINVQDYAYPDRSIATVRRIVDLHEANRLPVDIYLTTTMVDLYEQMAPDLLDRIKRSAYAAFAYHNRPPKPYHTGYDWMGLSSQSPTVQYATILNYETHGLDLVTGQPTSAPGGIAKLTTVNGAPPVIAAFMADAPLHDAVADVFRDLGAKMNVVHGRIVNVGDSTRGLYSRPEHYDMKLFEYPGQDVASLLDGAFATAAATAGARAPYFVGVKMHDNDFFADHSAWTETYLTHGRRPPWDLSYKSPLLSATDEAAQWTLYEAAVAYAATKRAQVGSLNGPGMYGLITSTGGSTPASAKAYISGTMHIETNRATWPDVDALLAFFQRAVNAGKVGTQATGMRWSVGADIGWLEGEPRAGEVIRTLSALGVEWDVHAHEAADRVRCAERISALGGQPNTVVSGSIYTEIPALRQPLTSSSGYRWQAQSLWGIFLRPDHRAGSDHNSYGLWRPADGTAFLTHDPNGNLIGVGSGTSDHTGAEALANAVAAGRITAPLTSAGVMVSPITLTVTNTTAGIDAIESWAARVGAISGVRWATISETARDWVSAGGVPSRIDSLP